MMSSPLRCWLPLSLAALLSACTGFTGVGQGVFRSPQPGEDQLFRRIAAHGIRTVACLRGDGEPSQASARATVASGATFVNVPMSATRQPRPETLLQLWHLAATAERPLLLHCRAGVDRTGLAAALVVLHDTGDLGLARGQLALVPFGHVGAFGTEAMGAVLDAYEPYAGRMAFPDWVQQIYASTIATPGR